MTHEEAVQSQYIIPVLRLLHIYIIIHGVQERTPVQVPLRSRASRGPATASTSRSRCGAGPVRHTRCAHY